MSNFLCDAMRKNIYICMFVFFFDLHCLSEAFLIIVASNKSSRLRIATFLGSSIFDVNR